MGLAGIVIAYEWCAGHLQLFSCHSVIHNTLVLEQICPQARSALPQEEDLLMARTPVYAALRQRPTRTDAEKPPLLLLMIPGTKLDDHCAQGGSFWATQRWMSWFGTLGR